MSSIGMPLPCLVFSNKSLPQSKRPVMALRMARQAIALAALWATAAISSQAQDYTFTTLAGVGGTAGFNNSTSGSAVNKPLFNGPNGMVMDSSGNFFVADSGNHTIRKVTPAGVVTTFAGTGSLAGTVDGTGAAARFSSPQGPAIDSSGNLYVADFGTHTIRKITPAGVVSTLAGSPTLAGSANGTGSAARFNSPSGVAVDSAGNVFVADSFNNQIRKITPAGEVTTFAGSPTLVAGFADGTGTAASFSRPRGIAVDGAGNVYVADAVNNTIRKISSTAVVTTLAGTANTFGSTDSTTGTSARFDFPCSVAVDSSGNLIVADQANHTIRRITSAGAVTTIVGKAATPGALDDTTGTTARLYRPSGVAFDGGGNIYVTDYSNHLIRKITASTWSVATIAGIAGTAGVQDGSGYLLISPSLFSGPSSTATDAADNIYVADTNNHIIRKITPAGLTTTFAGQVLVFGAVNTDTATGAQATFTNPAGVAVDKVNNLVYVADTGNHLIRKITSTGVVSTLAGTSGVTGNTDGTGTAAKFNSPSSLAVDGSGNVYVADYGNHTIRKITAAGVVTTIAGSGTAGASNSSSGLSASFNYPRGIAIDAASTALYVADTQNHLIRKVTLPGADVSTVAGSAGSADSKDASGTSAKFNGPTAVAVSSSGVIYVADTNNQTIRAISPGGVVTTIASLPGRIGSADGTGRDVRFNQPTGISVDSDDVIYVADYRNNTIRRGVSSSGFGGNAGGYDGGPFDGSSNGGGTGPGGGGTTPTGNGLVLRPGGLARDSSGSLYVADTGNNSIKKIISDGTITLFAGKDGSAGTTDGTGSAALFNGPTALVVDGSGNIYVADTGNATIRKITSAGVVTTFAGSPGNRGTQDGVGTAALFYSPAGIDMDSAGNLYVSDAFASTIRKITTAANSSTTPATPAATVTTFAGKPMTAGEADGTGDAARFNNPTGLTIDANSTIYVADTNNNTIRRINTVDSSGAAVSTGTVATVAGSPGISGSYDGTGSFALFSNPTGVGAVRSLVGYVYVADTGNNLVRQIAPGGIVTTKAGLPGIAGYRDGASSTAMFNQPKAVLASGDIYVADTGNSSIRVLFGTSVAGISLKAPTTTTPTTPTTPSTPSSSGGGSLECWFVGGLLGLLILARKARQTIV